MTTFKKKVLTSLKKLNLFLKKYQLIWLSAMLVIIYIQQPEIRWIVPVGIGVVILGLVIFMIIFCPISILLLILVPILWLSDKIKGEPPNEKENT
jgi:uncharacterized membrane protein